MSVRRSDLRSLARKMREAGLAAQARAAARFVADTTTAR